MKELKSFNFRETVCDKFLLSLLESITNVDISYIFYNYHDTGKDITHVERTFAYELYHQWSISLCKYRMTNYRIDAEVSKQFVDQIVGNESNCRDYETYYPDMVLHKSQGNDSGNLIACEFKRLSETSLEKVANDLYKLYLYVNENTKIKRSRHWTPYRYGFFLFIDKKNHSLSETLEKVPINFDIEKIPHKIICAIYNGSNLVYDYLENLIKR